MRWKNVALVLASFSLGLPSAFAAEHNHAATDRAVKATTPVEVSIYPVTSVSKGEESTFIVRATSSLPSDDFVIEIQPTKGSTLVSGDLSWQGPIMPGVAREMSVTLRMADKRVPSVSVTSSIQLDGGVEFAATATYRQQGNKPVATKAISRNRKVSRKGRQVIEYRLR